MILTVTMNPSVDISYQLEKFKIDTINRVANVHKTAGGKGLNVTRVLAQLGEDVTASGMLGGKLGEYIEKELDKVSIKHSFYKIETETRNCIAILHEGNQTEILEQGPNISKSESEGFLDYFEKILPKINIVSVSGSLPKGIETNYYSRMVAVCKKYNVPIVLDCSGKALLEVLQSEIKPTVIKPNTEELSLLINMEVKDNDDVQYLKDALSIKLFDGIDWVIVSLGSNGMFAKHKEKFYKVNIPRINVVSPVGSGDSTIAGITSALVHGLSDEELLKKANVLGMLNAQEARTGYVNLENYEKLYKQIEVKEV